MSDLLADVPEIRVVLESRDQNDFIISRDEVYGYWRISRQKGNIPEVLRGFYTRKETALSSIKNYLNTFALPRKIREIKEK